MDPGCEEALSQLAEIAVGQELLADATLYWNRLVQHRRERNDAPGVAQALMRLAGLPVAKADTKLAAARAAEPHVERGRDRAALRAAAEALAREGRAARRAGSVARGGTPHRRCRRSPAAARACLDAGCLERAQPFLTWRWRATSPRCCGPSASARPRPTTKRVATQALGRYRTLVPDQAERASALLAKWEPSAPRRTWRNAGRRGARAVGPRGRRRSGPGTSAFDRGAADARCRATQPRRPHRQPVAGA